MTEHMLHPSRTRRSAVAAALLFGFVAACHNSSNNNSSNNGPFTPDWPKAETALQRGDTPPGMSLEILSVTGGSDTGGGFLVGDTIKVTFTVKKNDGTWWRVDELPTARMLVAGPTFNYQQVIAEQRDIPTAAVYNGDHTWTYSFPVAIPANYLKPLNDTATFGAGDGELQGQALLPGTYTVGFYVGWSYTVDGEALRDAADATFDFLFGGASTITPRAVVGQENCNECHKTLQAHGGLRRSVALCVLCHTSGAEDKNNAAGTLTPDITIDFRVMIHKIHNAEHLPSVNGVATITSGPNAGMRDYSATPKTYEIAGFNPTPVDFSHVAFPVWPNSIIAMPRDQGYSALGATEKALEDNIRKGVANCAVCHGDGGGSGLTPPAQGDIAYSQPTRRACGACHDDVDFNHPYTANGSTMPAQNDDAACLLCHGDVGTPLHPAVAHLHPLKDPAFNTGTNFTVDSVAEAGTNDDDGTIDPGEKVAITFRVKDDSGAEIAAANISSMNIVFSGPTTNSNILNSTSIPAGALGATQPFTVMMPQTRTQEYVGDSTVTTGDVFTTAYAPHWDMTGAVTSLTVATPVAVNPGNTTVAVDSIGPAYWLDVASVTNFARSDYLIVDGGVAGTAELLQITGIDGNRLWFSGLTMSKTHLVGATVREVTIASKTRNTDWSLVAATGTITEVTEFGTGNSVFVTYVTDFVMPSVFPLSLLPSPDLDETSGNWAGKPIVDGTYGVTLWGRRDLTLSLFSETNSYRSTANAARTEILVGSADTLEPYALIDGHGDTCAACHKDVMFHGGSRRGFDACIACHGTSGGGDRPQFIAPNAPATNGTTFSFRQFLHRLHMGDELTNPSTAWFIGSGSAAWPNNYSIVDFSEIGFPAMPSGVKACVACHGDSNTSWHAPAPRNHPTAQGRPVATWTVVCGACHDSDGAKGHIESQTSASGYEACSTCHGEDRDWPVQLMHKIY